MSESELLEKLVDYYETGGDDCHVEPERHYNHYGSRGAVDLFVDQGRGHHVFELKSPTAVQEATGANEIVRQVTKAANYFHKGAGIEVPRRSRFELCFVEDPVCVRHIAENASTYAAMVRSAPSVPSAGNLSITVTSRPIDGDGITPLLYFFPAMDVAEPSWPEIVHGVDRDAGMEPEAILKIAEDAGGELL